MKQPSKLESHKIPSFPTTNIAYSVAAGVQLLQPLDVAGALPPVPLLRHGVPEAHAAEARAVGLHQVQHLLLGQNGGHNGEHWHKQFIGGTWYLLYTRPTCTYIYIMYIYIYSI